MKIIIIKRILAFLLFTLGILYILCWIQPSRHIEGFQIAIGCKLTTVAGRSTYMCDTQESATQQLNMTSASGVQVCYAGNYSLDALKREVNTTAFVCHDGIGEPQFDSALGVYVPFDPLTDTDTLPGYGEQDTIVNYTSLNSGYLQFSNSYANTSSLVASVEINGFGSVLSTLSTFNGLSNTYCAATPIQTKYQTVCNTINTGINTVSGIPTAGGSNSLSNISTIMDTSLKALNFNMYGRFLPGFVDSYTMSTNQLMDYSANCGANCITRTN
jgi:hypothetical protein